MYVAVPMEINLRGPLAIEAYNRALNEGKARVKRLPVMVIGQDRSGKTSLKNSLMGKPFNPEEDSTVGIELILVPHISKSQLRFVCQVGM